MDTERRILLLQACETYLETTPEHIHGFCSWATYHLGLALYGWVYDLICNIRRELSVHDTNSYVGDDAGPTPTRIQFVRDLRAYLLLDI